MINKLPYTKLKKCYKTTLNTLFQKNSDNLVLLQEKAIDAINFGLSIKQKNYNIYISGPSGTGKTTIAKQYANEIAKNESIPRDLAYVYNFDNPENPTLLMFDAGDGKIFKKDIQNLINQINIQITNKLNSTLFLNQKDEIIKEYNNLQEQIMLTIANISKENNFELRNNKGNVYFIPIIDEEPISEEEFNNLSYFQKQTYNNMMQNIQDLTLDYIKEIKILDNKLQDKLQELEYNTFIFTIGYYFSFLQEKYFNNKKALDYINKLKEDIILNKNLFIQNEKEDEILPIIYNTEQSKPKENITDKYRVNLIVDNSELKGAPVIFEPKPNYTTIFGDINLDPEEINYSEEYMQIKPGLLHKANGGYLIVYVKDLLNCPFAFEALMKTLETQKISIELNRENQIFNSKTIYFRPEPVPLNIKIILIGDEYHYDLLSYYDTSFLKYFKVHSIFDYEIDNSEQNILSIIQIINKTCKEENLLIPNLDSINLILQELNKKAETQNKLDTNLEYIKEILVESNYFAKAQKSIEITENHIKKTIQNRININNIYEQKLNNMILQNDVIIDTEGEEIGQINGLTILEYSDLFFGKPVKITATTYMGKSGIINVEKEAQMSGNIHSKGVQVLTGYLGQKYAQKFPLSLSCRICFEQNYTDIDGDSASSTELYAILSSLAEVKIKQTIAVTGSINQKGEIQPIGGVTQKIEGFFDICSARGLNGEQGVIIPYQNVKDLCLKQEVIDAVKNNLFSIYPIKNIDQGIEILTGVEAGVKDQKGNYPKGTIHFKVTEKLKKFSTKA